MAATFRTTPLVIPASDLADVAREQLEYLICHVAQGFCVTECHECGLLLAVRNLLFDRFAVTELDVKPNGWHGVSSKSPLLEASDPD